MQNYTVSAMVHLADDFFISLGLDPMPVEFYNNSMFEKPNCLCCFVAAIETSSRTSFKVSTAEWMLSASMAELPVTLAAMNLVTATPRLPARAA